MDNPKNRFSKIDRITLNGISLINNSTKKIYPQFEILSNGEKMKKLKTWFSETENSVSTFYKGKKYWYSLVENPDYFNADRKGYFFEIIMGDKTLYYIYKQQKNRIELSFISEITSKKSGVIRFK